MSIGRDAGRRRRAGNRLAKLALIALLFGALGASQQCGKPSVLVVGLDGANWTVLEPLIDAGYLPTIGGLVNDGARADMNCVPAHPSFPCFCPPVWTTIATGRPVTDHQIFNIETPSTNRPVAAIWNVASEHGARVTLSSWRGTWPPEPDVDYVFTEPGLDIAGTKLYSSWNVADHVAFDEPDTHFKPANLMEALEILPHSGPRPPSWAIFSRDRAGMTGLLDLVVRLRDATPLPLPTELTMITLHGPDKVAHLMWGGIQDVMWAPLRIDNLLAGAETWDGPVLAPGPYGWGPIAAPYLEIDAWLGQLLSARHYDYVVFVSDHGMTRSTMGFPGGHGSTNPEAHDGIFSITGPGVVPGIRIPAMNVFDVAPTLAYILELPISDELPGRMLKEAFDLAYLFDHPPSRTPTWD
jgi:hypothetical protein